MKSDNPFGGLQKMACDFTTNTVMMATSKYVKGGPLPIATQSNPKSNSTTANKPIQRRKQTSELIPIKTSTLPVPQSSKKSSPMTPNRLDQLGKGPLFKGMDEPLISPVKKDIVNKQYEDKNSPSANSDTKEHKFNRSSRKQLKSASKSKDKSFTSEISKPQAEKISPRGTQKKNTVDQRNLAPSKDTSYSRIPNRKNFLNAEKPTVVKDAKSAQNIESKSPPGKKFDRKSAEEKNKRAGHMFQAPQTGCQRHEKNSSRSREKLEAQKRSSETERQEKQKRELSKTKEINERKKRMQQEKQEELARKAAESKQPEPNQNRYGKRPYQRNEKKQDVQVSFEKPVSKYTAKPPVNEKKLQQKNKIEKKQQPEISPRPSYRKNVPNINVQQIEEKKKEENTHRYGRRAAEQEPQETHEVQKRFERKNKQIPAKEVKNSPSSQIQKPHIEESQKPQSARSKISERPVAKQSPPKPDIKQSQTKPMSRYGQRNQQKEPETTSKLTPNENQTKKEEPTIRQPLNRYGQKNTQNVQNVEQTPTEPTYPYRKTQKKPEEKVPNKQQNISEQTRPINRYGRKPPQKNEEQKSKIEEEKKPEAISNRYGKRPPPQQQIEQKKPSNTGRQSLEKQSNEKSPDEKKISPPARYGRTQKAEQPKLTEKSDPPRFGRNQQPPRDEVQINRDKKSESEVRPETSNPYGRKVNQKTNEEPKQEVSPEKPKYGRKVIQKEQKISPQPKNLQAPVHRRGRQLLNIDDSKQQPKVPVQTPKNRFGRKPVQEEDSKISEPATVPANRYGRKVQPKQQTQEPLKQTGKQSIKQQTKQSIREQVKQPIKYPAREPPKEPVKEPVKQSPRYPAKYPQKQATRQSIKQPVKQTVKQPIKQVPKSPPAKYPVREPIKPSKQETKQSQRPIGRKQNPVIPTKEFPKDVQKQKNEKNPIEQKKERNISTIKNRQSENQVEKQKIPRSNTIIFCLQRTFKNYLKEHFYTVYQEYKMKNSTSSFSQILARTTNSIFNSSNNRFLVFSFKKLKDFSSHTVEKSLVSQNKSSSNGRQNSKNLLCSCLHWLEQCKQRERFNILKNYCKKIKNNSYCIDITQNLQKAKLKENFHHLKFKQAITSSNQSFFIKQMILLSTQNSTFVKGNAFMKMFSVYFKKAKLQKKSAQTTDKDENDLKNSRMSQQNTIIKKEERPNRSKTQYFTDETTAILEKKIKQKRQEYEREKNHMQFRVEELRQLISENKYQVQSKKKQQQQLKDVSEKIGISQSQYIQSDVFESQQTKLPYLLEVYIFLKNQAPEPINIASLSTQFTQEGDQQISNTKQWQIMERNVMLKRIIDIYEQNVQQVKGIVLEQARETETVKQFVKSYIQEKYLWQWAKRCISN